MCFNQNQLTINCDDRVFKQTSCFLPHVFHFPLVNCHFTVTPEWFIPTIEKLSLHKCKTPSPVPVFFEASPEAALSNQALLEQHGCSIASLIQAYPGSCLDYGSEFRPIEALKPLLHMHPRWPKLARLLSHGSCWPVSRLDDEVRQTKNAELLSRGNHKSASTYSDFLRTSLSKEIAQGWMIPLPLNFLPKLKHAEIAPIGVAQQFQAHDDGTRSLKYRMVHDQSFEASVGSSVNKRVNKNALEPLFYGFCLSRTLHQIVALRAKYPNTRLLAAKTDFKAAYRRITLQGDTAARCTIIHDEYALPGLRLTFGGTPCAYEFCVASELCTDLAQDILHANNWDPRVISSPHAAKIPEPILLADTIPFGAAKELDVQITANDKGCIDDFVDDGVVVVPDIGDNRLRGAGALPLAIHLLCRPLAENEPVKRDDPLSLSKLSEEGTLAEQFVLLGWKINLRLLIISLPRDKFLAWSQDISEIIKAKHATFQTLDSVVGRLNHAAAVLSLARYFLNRIRHAAHRDESNDVRQKTNKKIKWLSKSVIADLQLFSDYILPKLHEGISLNLLTFRRPTHIFWSDACPSGLGGFSQHSGKAWRFEIPEEFHQATQKQNNLLEFIASVISVWIEILDGAPSQSCFLSFADNTSAVGWLHKANVNEITNKPLETATRHFATLLIQANCCLYSQHFKGSENKVADALSRRFDLTDNELEFFCSFHITPPGSKYIQARSSAAISILLGDLASAENQRNEGVTKSTKDKETRVWKRWVEYCRFIENEDDVYLQRIAPALRTAMFGAFAAALRRRQFSKPNEKELGAGTISETLAKLGQIFRSDVGYNPFYGPGESGVAPCLSRQFHGMKNNDPAVQPQKALPVCVFREMHHSAAGNHLFTAMADLSTCAFFWCMRSCEYTTVSGERRTKLLCLRNIKFYTIENRIIPHTSSKIFEAESVSVTFEFQKKLTREDTISHHRSKDPKDGKMCPVFGWASVVWRIANYPIPSTKLPDTPVNMVHIDAKFIKSQVSFLYRESEKQCLQSASKN